MPRILESQIKCSSIPGDALLLATARSDYRCSASHIKQMAQPFSRTPLRSDGDGPTANALEMEYFRTWPGGHVRLRDIARNGPDTRATAPCSCCYLSAYRKRPMRTLASTLGKNHCWPPAREFGGKRNTPNTWGGLDSTRSCRTGSDMAPAHL